MRKRYRMDDPIVQGWIDHWKTWCIDSVAHLTFRPRLGTRLSYGTIKYIIRMFLSRLGLKGNYIAYMEPHVDGRLHAHLLFEPGSVPHTEFEDTWRREYGEAQVHACGSRTCTECDDRPKCRWRRDGGGCGDMEYVARKMAYDGHDGGRIFERMRRGPA